MIRVLQIGFSRNPGGVENVVMNYFRKIDRTEIIFDFLDIYGDGIAYYDEIVALGGRVYSLPNFKKFPLLFFLKLKQLVRTIDVQIVHVHMQSAANILSILAALSEKKVVIAHSHSSLTPSGIMRKVLHRTNRKILTRLPIQKWACGKLAGEWMFGKMFSTEDIIPNAINMERFHLCEEVRNSIRKKYGFVENDKVLGFVGRFEEEKNPLFLLDILEELQRKSDVYKLLVVGGGDLLPVFLKKAEEKELNNSVVSVGIQMDTSKCYQGMDVFLLPSFFEGFPVVAIEAQAVGLCCCLSENITRDVSFFNENCFISVHEPEAVKKWAAEIEKLTLSGVRPGQNEQLQKYDIVYAAEMLKTKYKGLLR